MAESEQQVPWESSSLAGDFMFVMEDVDPALEAVRMENERLRKQLEAVGQEEVVEPAEASEGSAIILEYIKEMVHTGKPHPLGDEMVTAISVADAIREAEVKNHGVEVGRFLG